MNSKGFLLIWLFFLYALYLSYLKHRHSIEEVGNSAVLSELFALGIAPLIGLTGAFFIRTIPPIPFEKVVATTILIITAIYYFIRMDSAFYQFRSRRRILMQFPII
jgi:hypothetical protein